MSCFGGAYNNCYMNPQMYNLYPTQHVQAMDLEEMYPQVYYQVNPYVKNYCDMMGMKHGMMVSPTKDQLDMMVDNIHTQVQPKVGSDSEMMDMDNMRPVTFGFGGGGFLRDIIGILLIQELLRRRPYGYGGAGFYPGVYPGFYGY